MKVLVAAEIAEAAPCVLMTGMVGLGSKVADATPSGWLVSEKSPISQKNSGTVKIARRPKRKPDPVPWSGDLYVSGACRKTVR